MEWARDIDQVAIVSSHGLISHALNNLYEFKEIGKKNILYPMHELWAYAIKNSHIEERDAFISSYLQIMQNRSYWRRNSSRIRKFLRRNEVFHIHGSSQDWIKKAALYKFKKLSLTVPVIMGQNIGKRGQHSNQEIFEKNYQKLIIEKYDQEFYLSILKNNMDFRYLEYITYIELSFMKIQYEYNKKFPMSNKLFRLNFFIFKIINDNYQFLKERFLNLNRSIKIFFLKI